MDKILISIWLAGTVIYFLKDLDIFIDEATQAKTTMGLSDWCAAFLICLLWPILIPYDSWNNRRN